MGAAVEVVCVVCGTKFTAYRYDVEQRHRKCCSPKCQGISRRVKGPSDQELRRLYAAGLSTNELADRFEVSKGTIYNWFKKFGIQCRTPAAGRSTAAGRTPQQGQSAEPRACSQCGVPFTPELKTSRRTICSDRCMSAAGVQRMRTMRRGNARSGRRESLGGLYVRSSWEASYAAVLNEWKRTGRITEWKYEPRLFMFDRISRGNRSYTPDFQVFYPDGSYEWHEVKGYLDATSKTKLARFAKYYPNERLILIDKVRYKALAAEYSHLAGWEK